MNDFAPAGFAETVRRLLLGVELIDAPRRGRVSHPCRIALDAAAKGVRRPTVDRHNSCLHALLEAPHVVDDDGNVVLRVFDGPREQYAAQTDRRRFVPRRLRVPIPPRAEWDERPASHRIRRVSVFPGAAYDVPDTATGLRGRVVRQVAAGPPVVTEAVRWARVVARIGGEVVGVAHGDEHGEFLLLVTDRPNPGATLPALLQIAVAVSVPPALTAAQKAALRDDPLADVPVEELAAVGSAADPVADGGVVPGGYVSLPARTIDFRPGRIVRTNGLFTVV